MDDHGGHSGKKYQKQGATAHSKRNFGKISVRHTCATCDREIVDEPFVKCTMCKGFIQCLECFGEGYEKDSHIRTHPFVLMQPELDPCFSEDWTIEEELLLLHAIGLCGVGNWVDIEAQIKTKSAAECEVHYYGVYLGGVTSPTPDYKKGIQPPLPLPEPYKFDTNPKESRPSDGHEKNKKEKTTPAEISGYMPKRHEFEEEFNDDAEHLIDAISFDENESRESFEQKCKLLELYSSQIKERKIRIKVVEDWGIQYQMFNSLGGSTTQQKELDSKIITLAQFIGRENTEKLAHTLHHLEKNEVTIQQRQHWKELGVRTYQEGFLLSALENITKTRMQEQHVADWNQAIEKYHQINNAESDVDYKSILNSSEADLCKNDNIPLQIYIAMKDLFIRECSLRDGLTMSEALRMVPDFTNFGKIIYDHLYSVGWIYE